MSLHQGKRSTSNNTIEFNSMVTETDWNDAALFDAFLRGLADSVKEALIHFALPKSLDSLIALAIRTNG